MRSRSPELGSWPAVGGAPRLTIAWWTDGRARRTDEDPYYRHVYHRAIDALEAEGLGHPPPPGDGDRGHGGAGRCHA